MLERLIASERTRTGLWRTPGAVMSVALHGLLIAGAVALTRPTAESVEPTTPGDPFDIVFPTDPRAESRSASEGTILTLPPVDPGDIGDLVPVGTVPIDIPHGVADPDPRMVFRTTGGGTGREVAWPWAVPGAGDSHAPIHVAVADEPPVLLTSPAPVYPTMLRQAAIQGSVVFELVVDEDGRPEIASMRVLWSSHPMFEAAARRVVQAARYRPGRWHGRPVRVVIRQPVEFRLTGG